MYNIVTKLLTLRFRKYIRSVLSPRKIGFVPRCSILENISILYLLKYWTDPNKYLALFLELDIEKAFHRVNFD
jgi:hypothetical protein